MKRLLAILLLIAAIAFWWPARTIQGPSSDHEFEYLVRVSADGGSSDTLPMVISLHGDGGSPESFYKYLLKDIDYPARFIMLRGPKSVYGKDGWPRTDGGVQKYGDAIADAVSALVDRFPTKGRPLALGFSSGGIYSYYLAAYHGNMFSYVFPLSGDLPPELITIDTEPYTDGAKVIAFHGKGDQVVSFNRGASALNNLKQRGLSVEMVTYDGDHNGILSVKKIILDRLKEAMEDISH